VFVSISGIKTVKPKILKVNEIKSRLTRSSKSVPYLVSNRPHWTTGCVYPPVEDWSRYFSDDIISYALSEAPF